MDSKPEVSFFIVDESYTIINYDTIFAVPENVTYAIVLDYRYNYHDVRTFLFNVGITPMMSHVGNKTSFLLRDEDFNLLKLLLSPPEDAKIKKINNIHLVIKKLNVIKEETNYLDYWTP